MPLSITLRNSLTGSEKGIIDRDNTAALTEGFCLQLFEDTISASGKEDCD